MEINNMTKEEKDRKRKTSYTWLRVMILCDYFQTLSKKFYANRKAIKKDSHIKIKVAVKLKD